MFEGILQPTHLILILTIILIVFGPGKLPELGKTLGQSIRELRTSAAGEPNTPAQPENPADTVASVTTEAPPFATPVATPRLE